MLYIIPVVSYLVCKSLIGSKGLRIRLREKSEQCSEGDYMCGSYRLLSSRNLLYYRAFNVGAWDLKFGVRYDLNPGWINFLLQFCRAGKHRIVIVLLNSELYY